MKLTFVDASVLITAAIGKDEILVRKAFEILDDPERQFVSSNFVRLEVLPKAVYIKKEAEKEFYNAFFDAVSKWENLSDTVVGDAFNEACKVGLSATDALHITMAKSAKADEFITAEKDTKPFFKVSDISIKSIRPSSSSQI